MKIRFRHSTVVRMEFQAGDEISVATLTPQLAAVLRETRLDGETVGEILSEAEQADVDASSQEKAVLPRERARVQRPASVSS